MVLETSVDARLESANAFLNERLHPTVTICSSTLGNIRFCDCSDGFGRGVRNRDRSAHRSYFQSVFPYSRPIANTFRSSTVHPGKRLVSGVATNFRYAFEFYGAQRHCGILLVVPDGQDRTDSRVRSAETALRPPFGTIEFFLREAPDQLPCFEIGCKLFGDRACGFVEPSRRAS